jgi:hypothetical protein
MYRRPATRRSLRSNDEIGAQLIMSPLTAKTHVSRALTKLGLRDRAQLVVLGSRADVRLGNVTARTPSNRVGPGPR